MMAPEKFFLQRNDVKHRQHRADIECRLCFKIHHIHQFHAKSLTIFLSYPSVNGDKHSSRAQQNSTHLHSLQAKYPTQVIISICSSPLPESISFY